ncbi:hypothetical protein AAVH_15672 [Aphelenchoides avenae]|nr:hypothetical protein AAVH_15672 [Aphelenchus avenae]
MPLPSENWHEVMCFLARADLDAASIVDHRSRQLVARRFSVFPLRALEHVIIRDSTTPGARPGDVDCEVRARNTGYSRFVASVEELVEALRDSYVFHYVDITGIVFDDTLVDRLRFIDASCWRNAIGELDVAFHASISPQSVFALFSEVFCFKAFIFSRVDGLGEWNLPCPFLKLPAVDAAVSWQFQWDGGHGPHVSETHIIDWLHTPTADRSAKVFESHMNHLEDDGLEVFIVRLLDAFTASTHTSYYRARISQRRVKGELMIRSRTQHNARTLEQFTYTYSRPYSMLIIREPALTPMDHQYTYL